MVGPAPKPHSIRDYQLDRINLINLRIYNEPILVQTL